MPGVPGCCRCMGQFSARSSRSRIYTPGRKAVICCTCTCTSVWTRPKSRELNYLRRGWRRGKRHKISVSVTHPVTACIRFFASFRLFHLRHLKMQSFGNVYQMTDDNALGGQGIDPDSREHGEKSICFVLCHMSIRCRRRFRSVKYHESHVRFHRHRADGISSLLYGRCRTSHHRAPGGADVRNWFCNAFGRL